MTSRKTEAAAFEKEVVRLPDGRELTYYRFPDEIPPPADQPPAPGPGKKKER